ncbi:MAG: peroxiredoxin family protein [Flavobacteriales bacterium]|jgi:peroxiredoxin|nr:peroxiredoxin family protein [Flavobacteriales bacterium]
MSESLENKLKSIFLTALVTYAVIVSVIGIIAITQGANRSIWLSVTVSAATIVLYFARLYLVRVPRTSPGLMGFSMSIFGTTMYAIFQSYDQQIASIGPILGMICLSGWAAYVVWYSELGDRSKDRIKEGKQLPTIELEDYDGKKLSSNDWKGQKRLVLFYRGNWCPICTAQVKELTDFETKFKELGVKITLISPQSHDKSRNHAKRVGMDFDFFVDVNNSAAKTLGILQENGLPAGFQVLGYENDVPKPTTFVLDENGKVIFSDLTTNYRLRTRPEDILAALKN